MSKKSEPEKVSEEAATESKPIVAEPAKEPPKPVSYRHGLPNPKGRK